MYGGNNSLAVAVYDGHGGDAVSKELERVLLNVSLVGDKRGYYRMGI